MKKLFLITLIATTLAMFFSTEVILAEPQGIINDVEGAKLPVQEQSEKETEVVASNPDVVTSTAVIDKLDPLYDSLTKKNEMLKALTKDENNLYEQIKAVEKMNSDTVNDIRNKTLMPTAQYEKIINDIKALLDNVKQQKIDNKKNKINVTSTAVTSTAVTSDNIDSNRDSILIAKLIEAQEASLNLAVKGMRESTKTINKENYDYQQKLHDTQDKINIINQDISNLYNSVVAAISDKNSEWELFCESMYKKDLKAANDHLDNMILKKHEIVNNYTEIWNKKNSIYYLLITLL
jgi:hypothetical protein